MANQRTLLMNAALPISIVVALILIATLIQPVVAAVSKTQNDVSGLRANETEKRKLSHDIDTLIGNYKAISPDTLTSLSDFVPSYPNTEQLLASIGGMGSTSNLFQQSAVFDVTVPVATVSTVGAPQTVKANVVIKGGYSGFKQFLQQVETNKRLMTVDSVNFSSLGANGQSLDTVTFFVLLNSYFIQ